MKTRRPKGKKEKKKKTLRKRVGGATTIEEKIKENENGIAEAFNFIINEKYEVNDFTSPKCAAAMINDYKNIVTLKNEWGTGKFKDEEVVLKRMKEARNHLIDLYPDTSKNGGGQKGGIGWDFNKETQFLKIMKYIKENPMESTSIKYDGLWKGFSSKIVRFGTFWTGSKYIDESSQRGVNQRSTRELENIIRYYWCFVSYLLFIDSKITGQESIKGNITELIEKSKTLIDEYAKWNFMLKSDNSIKQNNEKLVDNILTNQPLLTALYSRIYKFQKDVSTFISSINKLPNFEVFKKLNKDDFTAYKLEQFEIFNQKAGVATETATETAAINELTKGKKDFAEVFAEQIKQSVIEADNESKNTTNEFDAEENSLNTYKTNFKAITNTNIIGNLDTLPEMIKKLKLEYNTNSEFIIRIMHLLEKLGNNTRDGQKVMNSKNLDDVTAALGNKLPKMRNHPFNRFAKVYISGIRTLIEVLIDVHTAYKKNNPTAPSLKISDLTKDLYLLRKNDYGLVRTALKRLYRMGENPGVIERNITFSVEPTDFKKVFTDTFSDLIRDKEIKMRFTNLNTTLMDLSNNVLSTLVFNENNSFLPDAEMKETGSLVNSFEGLYPKTEYNKLKKIWSDTSDAGLKNMEIFLKEKNKFKLDNGTPTVLTITKIKTTFNKTEQKLRDIFKAKQILANEDKQYLKNIQNCFFIIDHYASKLKKLILDDKITLNPPWKEMAAANRKFDTTNELPDLTYLWIDNITKYFEKNENTFTFLYDKSSPNISKVTSYVSDSLLDEIIGSCENGSNVITGLDIDFVNRLTDETVEKHLIFFVENIDKTSFFPASSTAATSTPTVPLSAIRQNILFRLLTLATKGNLKAIFTDETTNAIIEKMHAKPATLGGGRFDSIVGKKEKVFNIRSAYDNIFENAEPVKIIVTSLIETEKVVAAINILGTPDYNGEAIGKIRGVVTGSDETTKTKFATQLKPDLAALNFYSLAVEINSSAATTQPPSTKNKTVLQVKAASSNVEKTFRGKIKEFVMSDQDDDYKAHLKTIHKIYDELVAEIDKIKEKPPLLKNIVDNLLEYTESIYFSRLIEDNFPGESKKDNLQKALIRRDLLIDQFTRLNTKPIFDPLLERIVTTFWPEASSKRYSKPTPKTIKHNTILKTGLFANVTSDQTANETYGSKRMTLIEKTDGDRSDYDTLGVEMFLNALMTTGSNIGFNPKAAYEEKVEYEENLDNSLFVTEEE